MPYFICPNCKERSVDIDRKEGLFDEERNPAKLALEWGVRRLGEKLELRTRGGHRKAVTGDFFPAYDDDGGLLVAVTPRSE